MQNYAVPLPQDKNNLPLQEYPSARRALARYIKENGTTSSVVSLTHDTTTLEVAAVGGTAALRWVTTADTEASIVTIAGATSNFDHVIGTGTVRRFVVPREVQGSSQASVQGVNRGEGLFQRVAFKTIGIASVMLAEY